MNTGQRSSVSTRSSEQSFQLGSLLAQHLKLGDVIEFVGDLGGGKTTFIKGVAAGLGVEETVTSPTYNIQRSYQLPGGGTLEHYDLYRLGEDEVLVSEMRELIAADDSILCVEWADHFTTSLKPERFTLTIHYVDDTTRRIDFFAQGEDAVRRLESFIKEASSHDPSS